MSGMFSGYASFLRETIFSWTPRGKLRSRNRQVDLVQNLWNGALKTIEVKGNTVMNVSSGSNIHYSVSFEFHIF